MHVLLLLADVVVALHFFVTFPGSSPPTPSVFFRRSMIDKSWRFPFLLFTNVLYDIHSMAKHQINKLCLVPL